MMRLVYIYLSSVFLVIVVKSELKLITDVQFYVKEHLDIVCCKVITVAVVKLQLVYRKSYIKLLLGLLLFETYTIEGGRGGLIIGLFLVFT